MSISSQKLEVHLLVLFCICYVTNGRQTSRETSVSHSQTSQHVIGHDDPVTASTGSGCPNPKTASGNVGHQTEKNVPPIPSSPDTSHSTEALQYVPEHSLLPGQPVLTVMGDTYTNYNLTLNCAYSGFTTSDPYQWFKDGVQFFSHTDTDTAKYVKGSSAVLQLIIIGLAQGDAGTYKCNTLNGASNDVGINVTVRCICDCDCCKIYNALLGPFIAALVHQTLVICEVITIVLKIKKDDHLDAMITGVLNVVLALMYTIWFIVMRVEVSDCPSCDDEECADCSSCDDNEGAILGLLIVECISFVVGIISNIYLSCRYNVWKFWCSCCPCCKSTGCEPDHCGSTGNNQSPPSNDGNKNATQPKHSTFKTEGEVKHRPQPPPPSARNGSDLSGISRKDIDLKTPLAPIAPASTTSVHYRGQHDDEHSGMPKNRGLSAVFDEEPSMGPGNRLTPIGQVAEAEPKKKKKKKKKNEDYDDEEEE